MRKHKKSFCHVADEVEPKAPKHSVCHTWTQKYNHEVAEVMCLRQQLTV